MAFAFSSVFILLLCSIVGLVQGIKSGFFTGLLYFFWNDREKLFCFKLICDINFFGRMCKQIIWREFREIFCSFFSNSALKGQCHEIFCHFFISLIEAIWAPNEQSKMVLLKNSFSRRYSRNQWLCAVLACADSDSRRLTLRRVGLCAG